VRADDEARCASVSSRKRHEKVTDRVDLDLEADGGCCRAGEVVCGLFANAVAVAHDAAAAARRSAQPVKK